MLRWSFLTKSNTKCIHIQEFSQLKLIYAHNFHTYALNITKLHRKPYNASNNGLKSGVWGSGVMGGELWVTSVVSNHSGR